jgi:hypothetical protein
MKEPLLMRAVCYDSVLLTSQTPYNFFKDEDDELSSRFNDSAEQEVIQWIFKHPYRIAETIFFEELEIDKTYSPYFEVKSPIIKDNSGPGDIDILLIEETKPQYSIAIQAKRVKATIDENNEAHLKTSHIIKGIEQAKWMYEKYRFHKNYLMLVIVSDSHKRTNLSQMFRYNSVTEKESVYNHSGFGDLPEEVGIFILEINQPSINSIDHTAMITSKAIRYAKPVEQLTNTTDRTEQFLKTIEK